MSKILFHIGYPKTGTTTLQHLFQKLDDINKINYMGKEYIEGNKNKSRFNFYLRNAVRENKNKIANFEELVSNKINVISDEDFTHFLFASKRFNSDLNYENMPKNINKALNNFYDNFECTILVGIRNQVDLVYSYYVEMYKKIKNSYSNYDDFIVSEIQKGKNSQLSNLYFYNQLKIYDDFYDKIKFLFFEDLKKDNYIFYETIAEALDIECTKKIRDYFISIKKNNRNKNDSGKNCNFIEKNILGEVMTSIYNKYNDSILLKNIKPIAKCIYNKIGDSKKEVIIPYPTSKENDIIFNEFKDDNIKLANHFDLNKKKMKMYNYI